MDIGAVDTNAGEGHEGTVVLLGLRVQAEADPGILIRILQQLQALNRVPLQVNAAFTAIDRLYIEVLVLGLTEHRMGVITAKIRQMTPVLSAHWYRL